MAESPNDERSQVQLIIRQWIEEDVEPDDVIDVPEVTERIVDRLQRNDALLQRYLRANLYPSVHAEVMELLRRHRNGAEPIRVGERALATPEAMSRRAQRLVDRWMRWTEHTGLHHVRLPKMTLADLRAASERRRKIARTHNGVADWLDVLAERLGPEQCVEDVWSRDEIGALHDRYCTPDEAPATEETTERELVEAAD